jgi:tRNA (adenine57-N1/adenine58-N1)-methyltransferase
MDKICEGDDILLYLDRKRTYLVRVKEEVFHTHKGYIQLNDLIGRKFGSSIKSNLGVEFYALRPLVKDYIFKTRRRTQILYPKDMGYIVLFTGIGPGSKVVEAGTGSGAMTVVLANLLKPNGRVYSYEIREEFLENARASLQRAELSDYVELKLMDVTEGIDERGVDAVVLDLAVPWLVVTHAYQSLRGGGVLASFSPTMEQVIKTVDVIRRHPFVEVVTVELLMRRLNVGENKTRPETLMIGHTGYITTARKVLL